MNTSVETREYKLDGLKWLLVAILVAGGVAGNMVYGELNLVVRVVALLVLGLVAAFVALQTAKGAAFWELVKAARLEMRKVVWPTKPETHQTTLMVLIVVVVAAIALWGLDLLFGKLASLIIG
jgi:preprotein translocase subunit SecE